MNLCPALLLLVTFEHRTPPLYYYHELILIMIIIDWLPRAQISAAAAQLFLHLS